MIGVVRMLADGSVSADDHQGEVAISLSMATGGSAAITSTATAAAATVTATSSPAVTRTSVTVTSGAAVVAVGGGGPAAAAGLGTGTPSTPVNLPAVLQDRPHSGRGRVPPPVPPRSPRGGGGAAQATTVTSSFSLSRGGVAYLTMPPSPRYPGGSPRFSHLCSPSIGMTGYNIWHAENACRVENESMKSSLHAQPKGRQHYVWQLPTEDVLRLQMSEMTQEGTPSRHSSRRSSADVAFHAMREVWDVLKTASRPSTPVTTSPQPFDEDGSHPTQHHSLSHSHLFRPSCLDRQGSDEQMSQQYVLPDTHITSTSNSPSSRTLVRKGINISPHDFDLPSLRKRFTRLSPPGKQKLDKEITKAFTNSPDENLANSPSHIYAPHASESNYGCLSRSTVQDSQQHVRKNWDDPKSLEPCSEPERNSPLEYMHPLTRQSYAGVEGPRMQDCDPKRMSMIDPPSDREEKYINQTLSQHYARSRSPSPHNMYALQSSHRRSNSPFHYEMRHTQSPYSSRTASPRGHSLASHVGAMSDVTLYQNSPSKNEAYPSVQYVTSQSVGGGLPRLHAEQSEDQHASSDIEKRTFLSEI